MSLVSTLGRRRSEVAVNTLVCNGPFVVNPQTSFLRRFTLLSVVGPEADCHLMG